MSLLRRIVPGFLRRYLGRLRFPWLFALMALILAADLAVPDALPFVDEILLALASAVLGTLRKRLAGDEGPRPTGGESGKSGADGGSESEAGMP